MDDDKEIKEIDCQLYIPRLLYLRLQRREILKILCVFSFFVNVALFIFGFIFLLCIFNTRSYVKNGDAFWDAFKVKALGDNQIQFSCAFTSILTILSSFMIQMNNFVIFYHAHSGGLKVRLVMAQWFNKIIQALLFLYSIIPLATFSTILALFPVYFTFAALGEISSVLIFIYCGKVIRKEMDYMLPLNLMRRHKEEYYKDYLTKKKVQIEPNNNNKEFLESRERNANSNYIGGDNGENNRFFINN